MHTFCYELIEGGSYDTYNRSFFACMKRALQHDTREDAKRQREEQKAKRKKDEIGYDSEEGEEEADEAEKEDKAPIYKRILFLEEQTRRKKELGNNNLV